MRPLFTIHVGELVVADYIERKFRRVNLWIPTRDRGADLLVTDIENKSGVSLQVKFSRDYLPTHMATDFQAPLRACGWWSLRRDKVAKSKADYWVFVLVGFERRSTDFIVIRPSDLLNRFDAMGRRGKSIQCYLWVTEKSRCWETRGLKRQDQRAIARGEFVDEQRDFSPFLNDWTSIESLDG